MLQFQNVERNFQRLIWQPLSGRGYADLPKGKPYVLPVSTTRGTPSTSLNLKDAFCEKIPIYYDLIRNFRQQYGASVISRITVDDLYRGLQNVNGLVKETSEIDPKHGIKYRGLTMPEVITLLPREGKSPRVEAVLWLLLTGDVPTHEQTASLISDWTQRRMKKKDYWSEGGTLRSVLQTLPKTAGPSAKLSVALTLFNLSQNSREAARKQALSHTQWEYTYEDSMEVLAILPAIIGLIADERNSRPIKPEGDLVDFLLECLPASLKEEREKSVGDFLRLYITLNADEDGAVPGGRVTEILAASHVDVNQALAAGVAAYENSPSSGTMHQYMEFQNRLQRIFGQEPREPPLKGFMAALNGRDKLIGYRDTRDPRYTALLNYANEALPNNIHVKFSQEITQILAAAVKRKKAGPIYPEQTCMAAPIFEAYGWRDMMLNQLFLSASRALGSIASIIWSRAVDLPVEQPRSRSTYGYLELVRGPRTNKRRKGGSVPKTRPKKINERP